MFPETLKACVSSMSKKKTVGADSLGLRAASKTCWKPDTSEPKWLYVYRWKENSTMVFYKT